MNRIPKLYGRLDSTIVRIGKQNMSLENFFLNFLELKQERVNKI